jgi:hypothetical protein
MHIEIPIPKWWSYTQCERLQTLEKEEAVIAYWNSNEEGQSARYGNQLEIPAGVGVVHISEGPLRNVCGEGQLHATVKPLQWPGSRVWVVAMYGDVRWESDKCWCLKREIIGEIFPCDGYDEPHIRASIRPYANLCGADLHRANLCYTDLSYTDLSYANLCGADLRGTNLFYANLFYANLYGADLCGADLRGTNLCGVDLRSVRRR